MHRYEKGWSEAGMELGKGLGKKADTERDTERDTELGKKADGKEADNKVDHLLLVAYVCVGAFYMGAQDSEDSYEDLVVGSLTGSLTGFAD